VQFINTSANVDFVSRLLIPVKESKISVYFVTNYTIRAQPNKAFNSNYVCVLKESKISVSRG